MWYETHFMSRPVSKSFDRMSKQNIRTTTATVVLLSCLFLFASCQESIGERLERETKEWTRKNCPRPEFEDIIILDSLVFHNDGSNDYKLCYTFVADSFQLEEFNNKKGELRDRLLTSIINSADLRHVKREGCNIVYSYTLEGTDEPLCEFRFTKKDYGTTK